MLVLRPPDLDKGRRGPDDGLADTADARISVGDQRGGIVRVPVDQGLDCDQWLGQQVAIFDTRGITLKDIIRVTVNTEAAHSPPLERLMIPRGHNDKARFRVVRDREIHILSHIRVCGVRYTAWKARSSRLMVCARAFGVPL